MGTSLQAGVSGLKAHQRMLDVAGNNLANVNTTAYKASRVSFAELLGSTLREASQATSLVGGTNPMQTGSGVDVSSVDRNMLQGSMTNTGQPLDMAIDGMGFFVLDDGKKDVYTRVGSFTVDSQYYLVDPGTGYRVQRIGSEGTLNNFQDPTTSDIRIPYDVTLPAKATTRLSFAGNLSAAVIEADATRTVLTSESYKTGGALASSETLLKDMDQAKGLAAGDKLVISGTKADGTAVAATDFAIFNGDGTSKTFGDLITEISTLFPDSSVTITDGEIRLTDTKTGYSLTDIDLNFTSAGTSTFEVPNYFAALSVGGQASKSVNIDVYDAQGIAHAMSGTFVKTDSANKWDLVVNSIAGDADIVQRRIQGVNFMADGSFANVDQADVSLQFKFAQEGETIRKIDINFGTTGAFNGVSQSGGSSTVAPSVQDGYAPGSLSSVSVTGEGVLVGVFTNGVRADIAALQLATFQNPAGLASVGNNYFATSANSGDAVPSKALSGNAGSVRGGSLEKSNVDVSTEFVNLIEAQNGYEANARTIKVATDTLRSLLDLIR